MFARTTTFQARPELVEAGITYVRDAVIPMVERIRGCVGQSMLVDRQDGRCIVTAAWQSYRLMDANTERVQPMRDQATEILGGATLLHEEWEIAVLHRDHPSHAGACARVTWMRAEPDRLDEAVRVYKTTMLPAAEQEPGFCSASLFVDRKTARLVSTMTYESRDTLRTRDPAVPAPHNGSPPLPLEVVDAREFELVLAHLHVPELD